MLFLEDRGALVRQGAYLSVEDKVFVQSEAINQFFPISLGNKTFINKSQHSKMRRLVSLILLLLMDSIVNGQMTIMDIFIKDLLATFKFTSPTILYDSEEGVPEICYTSQWIVCLSTDLHNDDTERKSPSDAGSQSENDGMINHV